MLGFHQALGADCTIAVMEVPMEDAGRFGIMNTNAVGRILEFQEKPTRPKSNLASMGVYIFSWEMLRTYLLSDAINLHSDHDFGKNIIPAMLRQGEGMYAFPFQGYWQDVGTLESLWQTNMDMVRDIHLGVPNWPILSCYQEHRPPSYFGPNSRILGSLVSEGCNIRGWVENCVLSPGVVVEEGAVVMDTVIMRDVTIKRGAQVHYAILDEGAVVYDHALVGAPKELHGSITVVGREVVVGHGREAQCGSVVLKDLA